MHLGLSIVILVVTNAAICHAKCSFSSIFNENKSNIRMILLQSKPYLSFEVPSMKDCIEVCIGSKTCKSMIFIDDRDKGNDRMCHFVSNVSASDEFCAKNEKLGLDDLETDFDALFLECVECTENKQKQPELFKTYAPAGNRNKVWQTQTTTGIMDCANKCINSPFCHSAFYNPEPQDKNCQLTYERAPCDTVKPEQAADDTEEVWLGCFDYSLVSSR